MLMSIENQSNNKDSSEQDNGSGLAASSLVSRTVDQRSRPALTTGGIFGEAHLVPCQIGNWLDSVR